MIGQRKEDLEGLRQCDNYNNECENNWSKVIAIGQNEARITKS